MQSDTDALREAMVALQVTYNQAYDHLMRKHTEHPFTSPLPERAVTTRGEPVLAPMLSALVIGRAALVIAEKFGS